MEGNSPVSCTECDVTIVVLGVVALVYPVWPYCTYELDEVLVVQFTYAEFEVTPDVKTPLMTGPAEAAAYW